MRVNFKRLTGPGSNDDYFINVWQNFAIDDAIGFLPTKRIFVYRTKDCC